MPVRFAELGMTFMRDVSEFIIMRHEIDFEILELGNWEIGKLGNLPFYKLKRDHQEIIFPFSFINVIGEVAMERHTQIYN